MAQICIFDQCMQVPEAHLCGILCGMVSIFKDEPLFEIEVSFNCNKILPNTFPKSWCLTKEYKKVIDFCNSLQKDVQGDHLVAIPIYKDRVDSPIFKYNIKNEYQKDFVMGFSCIGRLIWRVINEPDEKIDWTSDNNFVDKCTTITNSKKFGMSVPCMGWDLPKITNIYQEQIAANLIGLFLRDCSDKDHKKLLSKKCYLRFHLYQDEPDELPDSCPYVYGYLRDISNCTFESHKKVLLSVPTDELACEVNLATRAFFWTFPVTEWLNKKIEHIWYAG